MQGITEYKYNGSHVLRVHYSADPDKAGSCQEDCFSCIKKSTCQEWKAINSEGMTKAAWDQEYEINYRVYRGKPWYPEFRYDFHVAKEPIISIEGRAMLLGWDYGQTFNPATVFCQTSVFGQLMVLSSLYGMGAGLHPFARACKAKMAEYTGRTFTHIGDPAGNNRSPNDEKSAHQILHEDYEILIQPGPVAFTARSEAIRKLLTTTTPTGQPMLILDPRCTHLISGFQGGYCRKKVGTIYLEEVDKNEFSHEMDGLGYIAAVLSSVETDKPRGATQAQTTYNPYRRR